MKAPKMQALISFFIGCRRGHMFLSMRYSHPNPGILAME